MNQASQLDLSAWVQLLNSTRHFFKKISIRLNTFQVEYSIWTQVLNLTRSVYKQLTLKTYEILFSELLFDADVTNFFALTLSAFAATENLADNTAHTYFFSHNITLSHFSSYLQKKVLANRTLKEQMFFMKRNKLMFKTKSVSNYIESLKRFLLHLQLLMHFTASISAWATELSTLTLSRNRVQMQYKKSYQSNKESKQWTCAMIMLVERYCKTCMFLSLSTSCNDIYMYTRETFFNSSIINSDLNLFSFLFFSFTTSYSRPSYGHMTLPTPPAAIRLGAAIRHMPPGQSVI